MFIREDSHQVWYDRYSQQQAKGYLLVLFDSQKEHYPNGKVKLYAAVRMAHLSQCGHFMMGDIVIAKHRFTVSGSYGNDGLPMSYEDLDDCEAAKVKKVLTLVPEELATKYWTDDKGWNSAGGEAQAMREWANENFKKLTRGRA